MSIVITDLGLISQLSQASEEIDVRYASGNFLGTFAPPPRPSHPGYHSPFSDEEIERRRRLPDGRSLAEILRDLEQHG